MVWMVSDQNIIGAFGRGWATEHSIKGMDMIKMVVNADDFGRDERVTTAILECLRRGWITQTTLMVNMPYANVAVERAREENCLDKIGLHLNFTEGFPLTDPIKQVNGICKGDGSFCRHRLGNSLFPFSREVAAAVRIETEAQIQKYLSYDLPLLHCDGHHHIHNRLQFAYVVLPILKQHGFKSVRNRYSIFTRPWIRGLRGRIPNGVFSALAWLNGLATTDGFGGWDGEDLNRWRSFKSVELMVHPNYDSNGCNVNVTDFATVSGSKMDLLGVLLQNLKEGDSL